MHSLYMSRRSPHCSQTAPGSLTVPILAVAVVCVMSRWQAIAAALLLAINPFHLALSSLAIEVPFRP